MVEGDRGYECRGASRLVLRRLGRRIYCRSSSGVLVRVPPEAFAEESAFGVRVAGWAPSVAYASYLVDPASSHMLVSKTKPCMSKYERFVL